jgi:N-acetylgalactosamine kinase
MNTTDSIPETAVTETLSVHTNISDESVALYCQLLDRAVELYEIQLKQSVESTVKSALRTQENSEITEVAGVNYDNAIDSRILFFSAPGRVNLIGEHTDYNNCPVLPAAVNREILAVAIPNDKGVVCAADLNPKYGEIEFCFNDYIEQTDPRTEIPPYKTGNWGNYIKAAVNELLGTELPLKRGYSIVFVSTIPQAAGMSSSSAMVVLSALVFLEVNGIPIRDKKDKLKLAELCRKAEWYTGTMGGGMDQAAILLGEEKSVSKIDFAPLKVQEVPFPDGYTVVVTHSTIEAPKTRRAMDLYNGRSIECRLAAAIAGEAFRKKYGVTGIVFIGDITAQKTGLTKEQIDQVVLNLFHTHYYSLEEAAELMGKTASHVKKKYCIRKDGSDFPIPEEGFKLYQRFHHVWSEWGRVEQSAKLLQEVNMEGFGLLMEESHRSCRLMHEISCVELDKLTELAQKAGALGSRLTGAGFGGCAVNLVQNRDVTGFVRQIKKTYYFEYLGIPGEESGKYIFSVHPVHGASLTGIYSQ